MHSTLGGMNDLLLIMSRTKINCQSTICLFLLHTSCRFEFEVYLIKALEEVGVVVREANGNNVCNKNQEIHLKWQVVQWGRLEPK